LQSLIYYSETRIKRIIRGTRIFSAQFPSLPTFSPRRPLSLAECNEVRERDRALLNGATWLRISNIQHGIFNNEVIHLNIGYL